MFPLAARLVAWGERRLPALTRHRRAEPLPATLDRRRIYIVPSAFGIGFALLLLVMLGGALNYANNAALLLTCFLGAASVATMLVAFRTLSGICLQSIQAGRAVAGETLELRLCFTSDRPRDALRLDLAGLHATFAAAAGTSEVTLQLPTTRRGWQPLPALRLWTTWPLGMFRAWSWIHPQGRVLVWPRAETGGPPPATPAATGGEARRRPGDELQALRDYRPGDPPRRIAWRASARHADLLVKNFAQPDRQVDWRLDWRALSGMDEEARIARLARWLGEAQAGRHGYSLWLPGKELPLASGPLHYAHCMDALAELP